MNIEKYLNKQKKLVDKALIKYFPPATAYAKNFYDAMKYSLFSDGKRLRAVLLLTIVDIFKKPGQSVQFALPAACAIEFVHTSSLILDDLPAMDAAEFRRGKPPTYKLFGEGLAILAADGLLTYAYELVTKKYSPEIALSIISELSNAIGTNGMSAGQIVDLQYNINQPDLNTLKYICKKKTGILFACATKIGAILVELSPAATRALVKYGDRLGLLFQITDDILDAKDKILSEKTTFFKKRTEPNFVSLLGIERAKKMAEKYSEYANLAIVHLGKKADRLRAISNYVLTRSK